VYARTIAEVDLGVSSGIARSSQPDQRRRVRGSARA